MGIPQQTPGWVLCAVRCSIADGHAVRRGVEVLERVAKLAKWEKRPSPKSGQTGNVVTGRGVTYCTYELVRTYVAALPRSR